jgi:protein kinase C substrate 80K-H
MFPIFILLSRADPFGIDPALSGAYARAINQKNDSFTCLDGSQTIPLSALNDGKCDCPDNSDEPGTSACLNGHFYCHNEGGKPKLIPSHKVGDGICDCCDGSDESDNPSAQCPNVCASLVEKASRSRESIYSKIRAGIRRKKVLLKEIEVSLPQAQRELRELNEEQRRYDHELDILNKNMREKKKVWKWEKRAAEGITPEQYAEEKRRKEEYIYKPKKVQVEYHEPDPDGIDNPFNEAKDNVDWEVDEGIEEIFFHATPRPKPYRRNSHDHHHGNTEDHGMGRIEHRRRKWKEMQEAKKNQHKEVTKVQVGFLDKAKERVKDISSKIFGANEPKSYTEYMEVVKEVEELKNKQTDLRLAIMSLENRLKHDFRKDNAWWPLSEQIFELQKDGNDYKLTIFGALMQRATGGIWYGTSYGVFSHFNETERTMLHESGQMCYEGNPRRTEIYLYCGPNDKFIDVEEIDRCVFRGHFATPLCCDESYIDYVKNMSDLDLTDFISQWSSVD